jgi:hypothetical protein
MTDPGMALWSAVSVILTNQSAAAMMDSLTRAGLLRGSVSPRQGQMSETRRKELLVDDVTAVMAQWDAHERQRFAVHLIEDVVKQSAPRVSFGWSGEPTQDPVRDELERVLLRFGWGLVDHVPYPLALQVNIETSALPDVARDGLHKALQRYREGDICGAITPIASTIEDGFAKPIWLQHPDWGRYDQGALAARVTRVFETLEDSFRRELIAEGIEPNQVTALWGNQRSAVANAAAVLGGFRNKFGDAHQLENPPHRFAQRALDCGVFIVRSFAEYSPRAYAVPAPPLGI